MKKKAKKIKAKISAQSILHKFENVGSPYVLGEKRLQAVLRRLKKHTKRPTLKVCLMALKKLRPGLRLEKQMLSGRTINKISLVSERRTTYDAIKWLEKGARSHDIRTPIENKIAKDLYAVRRAKTLRGGTGYAWKQKKEFFDTFRESRGSS